MTDRNSAAPTSPPCSGMPSSANPHNEDTPRKRAYDRAGAESPLRHVAPPLRKTAAPRGHRPHGSFRTSALTAPRPFRRRSPPFTAQQSKALQTPLPSGVTAGRSSKDQTPEQAPDPTVPLLRRHGKPRPKQERKQLPPRRPVLTAPCRQTRKNFC